ncbi:MAG: sugar transporter ATP-binding protein [Aeromicrobium sp.]|nr:sugar transporter ATP-binding protein [Aeromicrobium sp.]
MPIVSVEGVSKRYGPVEVLDGVDFSFRAGEITGLVGENGAGKSTLIKILAGAETPSSGSVVLGGAPLPGTTGAVIDAGLSVIYQELTDVPDMSLLDNVLLGNLSSSRGVTRRADNRRRAQAGLQRVGLGHLDLRTPIRELTISQRQLAEIARCLVRDTTVLILDEPTSALPERDVETLLAVVRTLRDEGIAILYVTHHLDELFDIADRVVVLRDGNLVGDQPIAQWDEASLVRAMLAKELGQAYPWRARPVGAPVLVTTDVVARGVRGSSVHVDAGEVVGLVGLAGSGRTELMKAIAGVESGVSGTVVVDGQDVRTGSIPAARAAGVIYVPEDRKGEGLVLDASVRSNIAMGDYGPVSRRGVLRGAAMTRRAQDIATKYDVKLGSVHQDIGKLSGGNQQKVIVGRVSEMAPRVVLFDDPTRGVDVGAKSGIYDHVFTLAESGSAVVVCSSDTDEVLAVADRVYVLATGRIVGEFTRSQFDREKILHLAAGGSAASERSA